MVLWIDLFFGWINESIKKELDFHFRLFFLFFLSDDDYYQQKSNLENYFRGNTTHLCSWLSKEQKNFNYHQKPGIMSDRKQSKKLCCFRGGNKAFIKIFILVFSHHGPC